MNLIANRNCRWLTATVTGIIVAAPTAIYSGLAIQAQKWGTSFVWDKGVETVSCVTQKDNAVKKIFKELNEQTSSAWNNVDNKIRNDLIRQGFSFEISAIDPAKNVLVTKGWLQQAVNSHHLYMTCDEERIICNNKLPKALNDANIAQKEIIAAKDASKAQIDPLLERKGECKELEGLKEEVVKLKLTEKDHIRLTVNIENLEKELNQIKIAHEKELNQTKVAAEKELNQTKIAAEKELNQIKINAEKELNQTKTIYQERIDNLNKTSIDKLDQTKIIYQERINNLNKTSIDEFEKMKKNMEKYKKLYEDVVWFPVKEEL